MNKQMKIVVCCQIEFAEIGKKRKTKEKYTEINY